jgi:hypothetical protein
MSKRVIKIDMYTNKIIRTYPNSSIASEVTGDTAPYIINQCKRRGGTEIPRQEYYYRWEGDKPTPHRIIEVYDLDFEKICEYISIKEAEFNTGVGRYSIGKQLQNKLPLRERKSPSSGLYFVWKEVK